MDFINHAHVEEVEYWKNVALGGRDEDERKWLTDRAPLRVFLARTDAVKKVKNVNEIIFYLKNKYLFHNEECGSFIEVIPSREGQFTLQQMYNSITLFSKTVGEVENMSLKNKVLLGGWILTAAKVFRKERSIRGENFPG